VQRLVFVAHPLYIYTYIIVIFRSRDSLVGITTGYGLNGGVRFLTGARFSLHGVQIDIGVHPASYLMGTRDDFLGSKTTSA
jgi:hypothetical protein